MKIEAEYKCNECGDIFVEGFIDEPPHEFYEPCPVCGEGEGKLIEKAGKQ